MKKLIFKMFMPKPAMISKAVVDATADFINGIGKEELIAKIAQQAQKTQFIQERLTKLLEDGKIDEAEKEELNAALLPLAEMLYNKVLERIG